MRQPSNPSSARDIHALAWEFHNVLDGFTIDRRARLTPPISFTKDPAARAAAFNLCREAMTTLYPNGEEPDPTALYRKFLSHLSKIGAQDFASIEWFRHQLLPLLIEAFRDDLTRVTSTLSIPAILRARDQKRHQEEAEKIRAWTTPPPRPVLFELAPYSLTELTHPLHLYEESRQLEHCLGRLMTKPPINAQHLHPADPKILENLTYWRQMRSGTIKLYSLRKDGRSIMTIQYATKANAIVRIAGRLNRPAFSLEPLHYRHLRLALDALEHQLGPFHNPLRDPPPASTAHELHLPPPGENEGMGELRTRLRERLDAGRHNNPTPRRAPRRLPPNRLH